MSLTPEAKKLLAETVRGSQQAPEKGLRAKLLRAIHDEADRRYRLSVPIAQAGLDEAHRKRRERLEAWLDQRARATKAKGAKELKAAKERLLAQAEKEAAATLLNRLVLLRQLEAAGLSKPQVVTGGWSSKGYREFREFAPTLCSGATADETEGYATLLALIFDELSVDLPGLYGDVGLTKLFPIPAATLREVVERLDNSELVSAWTDDTTLGWVYQYWNDPDREALDGKINEGGKIEPHEIASKTQMFTERYMVEWLLQNSLGLTWLAICEKHGWTADAERVLPTLDARRAEWRKRREASEVALDALMPIEGQLEEHWKYYVPQPIPEDAVEKANDSVRSLKVLDPACGSGHFLVIAFDLLAALYREEARHRGQSISEREIAESILENNLYGIDIDPRATQIAASGLYLKCKTLAKDSHPKALNLVAPSLQLGNLPADDAAVVNLREDLRREVGIPEALTNKLLTSLAGVDYLGSLLKVDAAVGEALRSVELEFERTHGQGDLFGGFPAQQVKLTVDQAKATVLEKLELFLAKHSRSEDLGLRLDGEQLASGVRFVRMARECAYDVVVGNPPYQGISKTAAFDYVARTYPRGKADLYAAFLERSLQLTRPNGLSALVTMRGWMFLGQFTELRKHLLSLKDLHGLVDLDSGAFEEISAAQVVVSVVCTVFSNRAPDKSSVALRPTPVEDRASTGMTARKRAGLLAQVGRHEFDPRGFEVIEGEPLVYWWSKEFLKRYADAPKLGLTCPARVGLQTSNNTRFVRYWWEVDQCRLLATKGTVVLSQVKKWVPYIKGAAGRAWYEPLTHAVDWASNGLAVKAYEVDGSVASRPQNEHAYFRRGVAFSPIGATFSARLHRFTSIFDSMGSSVFPADSEQVCCLMNSKLGADILQALNPTVHFQVGDVSRLAIFPIPSAHSIYDILADAFERHESTREASKEFSQPGLSAWRHAQQWAQRAVDRSEGEGLPVYEPVFDSPSSEEHLSFAIGVVLGRFDATGLGLLDKAPATALSFGILFVSAVAKDSLEHAACKPLLARWAEQRREDVSGGEYSSLSEYLRKGFFAYHKKLYENRPIYFPLSSAKKSFVAFISIHRWQDDTLSILLADHIIPTRRRLEGELDDLRTARASGSNKGKAEKRFAEVQKLLEELNEFIAKVTEIAENGPPPPDDKTPKREVDAKYVMDLDDGVMVNSAALWPLLEPQWKDPKKWWKELASAQGKKDYDWSHLAARYFPTRVRAKCHTDPSLAVAHKCFWTLHPAKAYAWELRLQDEIKPDFTIDEPGSDEARAKFLFERSDEAKKIHADEMKRRERKAAKQGAESEGDQPLLDRAEDDEADEDGDE